MLNEIISHKIYVLGKKIPDYIRAFMTKLFDQQILYAVFLKLLTARKILNQAHWQTLSIDGILWYYRVPLTHAFRILLLLSFDIVEEINY